MIAVISHDAGGAEILSSYVLQQGMDCCFVLGGPAQSIFKRKLGAIEVYTLEEAIGKSASILCGTSWQSDIEFNAIKLARSLGKRSVAFLDHWVNYRDRFIRMGEVSFPDEILVGDAFAMTIAKEVFPNIPVSLVNNPYVLEILHELSAIKTHRLSCPDSVSVLYICEPISEHALIRHGRANFWGYVEEDALRYFLSNISSLGKKVERILIRPHPSERVDKYRWAQHEFDLPIEMGGNRTLLEEIAESDIVVGCESMAMVIASLVGKKVVCSIPPGGRGCILPISGIINLQNILK